MDGFTGFLAEEINNITFTGEREAAVNTLLTFNNYLVLDQKIRQLQQMGKKAEAIALCTGYNPGQSNWAFEQFKQAHQKTLDINMKAFEQAVDKGTQDVHGLEITTSVVTVAISFAGAEGNRTADIRRTTTTSEGVLRLTSRTGQWQDC